MWTTRRRWAFNFSYLKTWRCFARQSDTNISYVTMFDRELHSHISSLRDYMPIELQNRKKTRNPFNLRWLNTVSRLKVYFTIHLLITLLSFSLHILLQALRFSVISPNSTLSAQLDWHLYSPLVPLLPSSSDFYYSSQPVSFFNQPSPPYHRLFLTPPTTPYLRLIW